MKITKKKTRFTPKRLIIGMLAICILLLIWVFGLDELKRKFLGIVAVLAFIFLGLGIFLIVQAVRLKYKGWLKLAYILAGASAIGIPLLSILHNVFYALGMMSEGMTVLVWLFEALHVTAFILSVLICPILFLVCAVYVLVKDRK